MIVLFYGIIAVICASLLLGIIPSVNKLILLSGMSSGCIVFLTYLTSASGMLFIILIRREPFRVRPVQFFTLLFTGFSGLGMTGFLLNMAYELIPVGLATMLHFLYPSLVSVAMILFFRQRITLLKSGAILFSIAGMFLIADLSGGLKFAGILIALCSSLTYSFYFIINEKGCISVLPLTVKFFYVSVGSSLMFGILTFSRNEFSLPSSPAVGVELFLIAGLGSMLAFFLITYGIKKAGASTSSFLNMLEPITSLIVGSILYQEYPSLLSLAGCAFVLFSVLLAALDSSRCASSQSKTDRTCTAEQPQSKC